MVWRQYGYITTITMTLKKSQIKKIYDSVDSLMNNSAIRKYECSHTQSSKILYVTPNRFKKLMENMIIIFKCRNNISFVYDFFLLYFKVDDKLTSVYTLFTIPSYFFYEFNSQKIKIEYMIKQITIEYSHIYDLIYDYLLFCAWSFGVLLYIFFYDGKYHYVQLTNNNLLY